MPQAAVRRRLTVVRVIVVAVIFMLVDEQALVRFGLNQQENAVHGGGNERDQQRLPGGEIGARQCHWEHQYNNCQREEGDQILFNTKQVHILSGEFAPAQKQREAYQTAGHNHNDRIQRIAHQSRCGIAGCHQCGN
ncbi:hypothetical protein D3C71_1316070 [compost metagenome]